MKRVIVALALLACMTDVEAQADKAVWCDMPGWSRHEGYKHLPGWWRANRIVINRLNVRTLNEVEELNKLVPNLKKWKNTVGLALFPKIPNAAPCEIFLAIKGRGPWAISSTLEHEKCHCNGWDHE